MPYSTNRTIAVAQRSPVWPGENMFTPARAQLLIMPWFDAPPVPSGVLAKRDYDIPFFCRGIENISSVDGSVFVHTPFSPTNSPRELLLKSGQHKSMLITMVLSVANGTDAAIANDLNLYR